MEEQKAEELFLAAMRRSDGKFDEAMSELDEVDDATAKRLLGWAAHESKSPGVCVATRFLVPGFLPPPVGHRQCSSPFSGPNHFCAV